MRLVFSLLPMPVRRSLLTVLLVLAAALAAPGAAGALQVGVAEQTPEVFHDPRFIALGLPIARVSVSWDLLTNRRQAKVLDTWLRAAHSVGVSPLISFNSSYIPSHHHRLPSPGLFVHQFRIFRSRYPWVHDFATWNEANYCIGEATCNVPGLVASYYRGLRRACPRCNILAAELLDDGSMVHWARQFVRALGHQPALWGLHNYIGANRLQTASTQQLLRATTGAIWFTETGGVVYRRNHRHAAFPQSQAHAALVTRFLFERLVRLSRRITRVYVYQWNAGWTRHPTWDSGLVGPGPHYPVRPALGVLVRELARFPGSVPPAGYPALLDTRAAAVLGALYGPAGPSATPTSGPLAGRVTVSAPGSGAVVLTRTVARGQHFVLPLAPGSYQITATLPGSNAVGAPGTPAGAGGPSGSSGPTGSTGPSSPSCRSATITLSRMQKLVLNLGCSPKPGA